MLAISPRRSAPYHHAHSMPRPSPQTGQAAEQLAPPKSASKPKSKAAAAAAALSADAKTAMAMVEAVAKDLPKLDKDE